MGQGQWDSPLGIWSSEEVANTDDAEVELDGEKATCQGKVGQSG